MNYIVKGLMSTFYIISWRSVLRAEEIGVSGGKLTTFGKQLTYFPTCISSGVWHTCIFFLAWCSYHIYHQGRDGRSRQPASDRRDSILPLERPVTYNWTKAAS